MWRSAAQAKQACGLTGRKNAASMKTLTAVQAETSRVTIAISTWQAGKMLRTKSQHPDGTMLRTFETARPWRGQQKSAAIAGHP